MAGRQTNLPTQTFRRIPPQPLGPPLGHSPPTPSQRRLHHRTQRPNLSGDSCRPAIRHHRPSSPPALLGHPPSTFHPSHRLALHPGKPHLIKSFSFCSDIFSHFELSPDRKSTRLNSSHLGISYAV